jgi:hypothetical protein
MTREQIAWAAGFFEGEGTVGLRTKVGGRGWELSVEVTQIDHQPLDLLHTLWGGSVYRYKGSIRQRPFGRWSVGACAAARFLTNIQSFVVRDIVRRRIQLALAFQDSRRGDWTNRSAAYRENSDAMVAEMKTLNLRGRAVAA